MRIFFLSLFLYAYCIFGCIDAYAHVSPNEILRVKLINAAGFVGETGPQGPAGIDGSVFDTASLESILADTFAQIREDTSELKEVTNDITDTLATKADTPHTHIELQNQILTLEAKDSDIFDSIGLLFAESTAIRFDFDALFADSVNTQSRLDNLEATDSDFIDSIGILFSESTAIRADFDALFADSVNKDFRLNALEAESITINSILDDVANTASLNVGRLDNFSDSVMLRGAEGDSAYILGTDVGIRTDTPASALDVGGTVTAFFFVGDGTLLDLGDTDNQGAVSNIIDTIGFLLSESTAIRADLDALFSDSDDKHDRLITLEAKDTDFIDSFSALFSDSTDKHDRLITLESKDSDVLDTLSVLQDEIDTAGSGFRISLDTYIHTICAMTFFDADGVFSSSSSSLDYRSYCTSDIGNRDKWLLTNFDTPTVKFSLFWRSTNGDTVHFRLRERITGTNLIADTFILTTNTEHHNVFYFDYADIPDTSAPLLFGIQTQREGSASVQIRGYMFEAEYAPLR